jgi:HEPN domain-containing protein
MARKRFPPDDPREWLNRAKSNLVLSRITNSDVYLEDNCFDAQQAAEKAIKAVFIHRGESFPYIHNLEDLLKRLERNGLKIPTYVHKEHELTCFASEARYPGASGRCPRGSTAASSALPRPFSAGPSARLASHDPQGMQASGRGGLSGRI